jgi:hypothetical protein
MLNAVVMIFFEYVSINCLERDAEGKFRFYEGVLAYGLHGRTDKFTASVENF